MEETHIPPVKPEEERAATRLRPPGTAIGQRRRAIVAVGGSALLVLSLVIVILFVTHPPRSSLPGTSSTRSSQSKLPSLAKRTSAPATLPLQPLPCTVNPRTWTDGSPGWQIHNSVLFNTGATSWNAGGGPTIIAPCDVSSAAAWASTNIAVQTAIRVTGAQDNACFGITIRGTLTYTGWQGYKAGVGTCLGALDEARITGPDYLHDTQAKEVAFHPGTGVHMYRVEIEDTTIRFFIDGKLLFTTSDTRYLTGLEVGLWSQHAQLAISSFKVTSLSPAFSSSKAYL